MLYYILTVLRGAGERVVLPVDELKELLVVYSSTGAHLTARER